jgi:anti-anti-sigma factor
MREQVTITLKNRLAELERVATAVAHFAEQQRLSTKATFDVSLALDEVLTNVIRYAYEGAGEHEITVRLVRDEAQLTVETEDDGRAFNPLEIRAPDVAKPLAERQIGGLGMHLVRSVMDGLEYARRNGKNVLRMTKSLAPEKPNAEAEPPGDLRITETLVENGIVAVELAGRLHGRNAERLEERLLAAISAGSTRIVLDVAALDYFGSAGVRVLLVAAKRLRDIGAIALASPKDFIRSIIDVAGLGSIVTIHADRDAAFSHLRRLDARNE